MDLLFFLFCPSSDECRCAKGSKKNNRFGFVRNILQFTRGVALIGVLRFFPRSKTAEIVTEIPLVEAES